MFLRLAARDHHGDDEVGRVTGRRQHSATLARLVHRRHVDRLVGDVRSPARLEPDRRQHVEQHARVRLVQLVKLAVPARSVDEQTVDVRAVVRRLVVLLHSQRRPAAFENLCNSHAALQGRNHG